jgi:hypothetical protein
MRPIFIRAITSQHRRNEDGEKYLRADFACGFAEMICVRALLQTQ